MASAFHWYELRTTDPKAAADFYAKVVGWTATEMGSAEQPYTVMNADKGGVAGIAQLSRTPDAKPSWVGYVAVDNADAYVERLKAAGGTLTNGPHQVPSGDWVVQGADPQGVSFHLVSLKP